MFVWQVSARSLYAGTTVSPDASNDLLDLICLYGDRDPVQDDKPEAEDVVGYYLCGLYLFTLSFFCPFFSTILWYPIGS